MAEARVESEVVVYVDQFLTLAEDIGDHDLYPDTVLTLQQLADGSVRVRAGSERQPSITVNKECEIKRDAP